MVAGSPGLTAGGAEFFFFFPHLLLTTATVESTFVRLAGNSLTEPPPCLRVHVVWTDEWFRNQLSRSIFLLVAGSSTVPGWELLDYAFRTSQRKIQFNDFPSESLHETYPEHRYFGQWRSP